MAGSWFLLNGSLKTTSIDSSEKTLIGTAKKAKQMRAATKKKILFFLDYYLPHCGGVETVFEQIIK